MTHVLIPIAELDEREAELRKIRNRASGDMQAFYASAISEIILLKSFGKQIALDDQSIEDRATKYVEENLRMYNSRYKEHGRKDYKQALKDLL